MNTFTNLQDRHGELLQKLNDNTIGTDEVLNYIADVKRGATILSSAREREQLRANLRFWAKYVFDQTSEYPNIDLAPSELILEKTPPKRSSLQGIHKLIGLSALLVGALTLTWILARYISPTSNNVTVSPTFDGTIISTNTVTAIPTGYPSATYPIESSTSIATPNQTATFSPAPTAVKATPTFIPTPTRISGLSVTLIDPRDGDSVQPITTLSGNYVNLRENWSIHAILQPISKGGIFYPASDYFTVPPRSASGIWSIDVKFGDENSLGKPEQYNILVVVANNQSGRDFLEQHSDNGFTQLPSELIVFSDVTTVLRPAFEVVTGERLLYSRFLPPDYRQLGISMTELDGANERHIISSDTRSWMYPALSPDGNKLVVVEYDPKRVAASENSTAFVGLWLFDSNGENPSLLLGQEYEGYERPAWSPDGRYIAFSAFVEKKRQILIYDILTLSTMQITNELTSGRFPSWFADGESLIYNRDNTGLYRIDFTKDGKQILLIQSEISRVLDEPLSNETHPAVSPDGQKVAFTAAIISDSLIREIRLLNLTTGIVKTLTTGSNDQFPSWHPNGQFIYFDVDEGDRGIWLVDKDGNNLHQLPIAGYPAALRPNTGFINTFFLLEE